MKSLKKSLLLGASALAGASAAHAQSAAPATGACADRERFGALYEQALKDVTNGVDFSSGPALDAAMAKLAAVVAKACPGLPWRSIAEVAMSIADEDMAVKLGTTPRHVFEQRARQYNSAAQNAISSCTGGSVIDLTQCLKDNVCRETGSNSCLCRTPEQKEKAMVCL